MAIITLFTVLAGVLVKRDLNSYQWVVAVGIIGTVVVMLVLLNTICKVKNPQKIIMSEKEKKTAKKVQLGSMIFTAVLFLVVGFLMVTGDVKIHFIENGIQIQGSYWVDKEVLYEDIQEVSYLDEMNVGRRNNGVGSFKLNEGQFKNEKFGKYIIYSYVRCKSFVILETKEGVIALNAKTEEGTLALYDELMKKVG